MPFPTTIETQPTNFQDVQNSNGLITSAWGNGLGGVINRIQAASILVLPGRWRSFESFGGAQNQSLALQTTAWNAYLTWASGNLGGVCTFGPYLYQHLPSLMDIPSYGGVWGSGWATILQMDATVTGHGVANHISSNGTTDPNGIFVSFRHFFLDMSQISPSTLNGSGVRTAVGTQDGVHVETNPTSGSGGSSTERFSSNNDMNALIDSVFVWAATRDNYAFIGKSETGASNCRAYSAGRYGYNVTYDMNFVGCTTGLSGDHGFLVDSSSVRLAGCKAWFSGQQTNAGYGFRVFGLANGCTNLVGCEAQDNKGGGFQVDTCAAPVNIIGCTADSNSTGSAGANPALDIWNSSAVIADVNCGDRFVNSVTTQLHALRIRSTSNGNTIRVKNKGLMGATVGTPIDTNSDFVTCTTNEIYINSYGSRNPDVFTATYTPDPTQGNTIAFQLTGNVTIAAPVNGTYWPDARMTFVLVQDGTGGRTITWNTIYKTPPAANTSASTTTVATFEYDGTVWRLLSFRTGDV